MEKIATGFMSLTTLYKIFQSVRELPILTVDIGTLIIRRGETIALITDYQRYLSDLRKKYQVYILIQPHQSELANLFEHSIIANKIDWMEVLLRINSVVHIESDHLYCEHVRQITSVVDLSKTKFKDYVESENKLIA